jgi:hypothetical protein
VLKPIGREGTNKMSRDFSMPQLRAAIKGQVIVPGDAGNVRPEHIVEMLQLLGGGQRDAGWDGSGMSNSRLTVLPATTHYNIISSPLIAPFVTAFLDASSLERQ